ncbi:MAG: hypothetical protein WBQ17_09165 [Rhizomicrobium sp.]
MATPALAAGVVLGVSAAATTVVDATQPGLPDAMAASASDVNGRVATHGPARLSILVGDGDLAWQNVGQSAHAPQRPR